METGDQSNEGASGGASNLSAGLQSGGQVGGRRFTLIRPLSQGSMGSVWLARDERLGEEQTLRFLPVEICARQAVLDDLRQEVLKSRHLSHPNLIRIFDFHQEQNEPPFIAMEYVEGTTLEALRLREPERVFSWDFLKPLVQQLCDALEYAHSEGFIHRDLKPANLLLDGQGQIKLADCGIAAALVDAASRVSLQEVTGGAVAHMSPQQMSGEPPAVTDDIYSLGATLYELLTSKPPFFSGDIPHQVRKVAAKPIEQRQGELGVRNAVPEGEAAMVMACLAKRPRLRPQSAHQVAAWVGLEVRRRLNVPSLAERGPGQSVEELEEFEATESGKSGELDAAFGKMELRRQFLRRTLLACAVVVVGLAVGFGLRWKALRDAERDRVATPSTNTVTTQSTKVSAGSLDLKFDTTEGPDDTVVALAMDASGRVIVGGSFTNVAGTKRVRIARLNQDGSLDKAFDPGPGANDVRSLALQRDGKVLVGGHSALVESPQMGCLMRLNADGSLDAGFQPPVKIGTVHGLTLLSDGRILGGCGMDRPHAPTDKVFRLSLDGTPDPTFKGSPEIGREVRAAAIQPDGKTFIGGSFGRIAGIERGRIARLNGDGTLDSTFAPSPGADRAIVWAVALAPDGKVYFAGDFTKMNSVSRHGVARLNADGSLDTSFDPRGGANGSVYSLVVQRDGKVLVAGEFKNFAGSGVNYLVRLETNGTVDTTFNQGLGVDGPVRVVKIASDGQILIGGSFQELDGHKRTRVARLNGDSRAF